MRELIRYYQADDYNHYCFFQPLSRMLLRLDRQQEELDQALDLPNPLDRYRVPIPRLVPKGYF
jgi:hypothetical protein